MEYVWWMEDGDRLEEGNISSKKVRKIAHLMSAYFIADEAARKILRQKVEEVLAEPD